MSFTVYKRRMDGQMIPIKMSIWDAFRGAPNPRPKKKEPCACCGKFHGMTDKARDQVAKDTDGRNGALGKQMERKDQNNNHDNDNKNKNKNTQGKADGQGGKKSGFSTSDEETYSPEDDIIIMRMKSESQSWNDILKAIGKKSQTQLKAHYKQMEGKPLPCKSDANTSRDDVGNNDANKDKAENNKIEGLKKQEEANADKRGKGKKGKGRGGEKMSEKSSDVHCGEPSVKAWADRYDKQKWIAIASKHFDKTGERITPERAREMAEGK